jgi:hypothetical protein
MDTKHRYGEGGRDEEFRLLSYVDRVRNMSRTPWWSVEQWNSVNLWRTDVIQQDGAVKRPSRSYTSVSYTRLPHTLRRQSQASLFPKVLREVLWTIAEGGGAID